MAVISKGIKLYYKSNKSTSDDYTEVLGVQEIPELNGDVEAIEITTLADEAHRYTSGIKNYGDSLSFKVLYDTDVFHTLMGYTDGEEFSWKVELPDNSNCVFTGTMSVKLDGVGVNAALTFTLNIKPSSAMTWAA